MQLNTINRRYLTLLVLCLLLGLLASAQAPLNHIRIRSPRTKIGTGGKLDSLTGNKDSVSVTYQYLDGLGRPLQTVQQQGSPTGRDIVQPYAYDQYGREAVKYLPYTAAGKEGQYRQDALGYAGTYQAGGQYYFYRQAGQGYVNTPVPYAGTAYEPSPLNRVTEQGAPGQSWQLGGGHTVSMDYSANSDDTDFGAIVQYFAVTNPDGSETLNMTDTSGVELTYAPGTLYLTTTRDENWTAADGRAGTIDEYKDKQGRVICKKTFISEPSLKGGTLIVPLSTYYVYDDLDRLAFVLPPIMFPDSDWPFDQVTLDNLACQYRYDARDRMTQKKLPGKGWEYMLYNSIDQVVATQDSMQRAQHEWIYTKYDGQGRTVMTGLYNDDVDTTQTGLQAEVKSIATLWETPQPGDSTGYSHNAWPVDSVSLLTANYYDDYHNIPHLPSMYGAPANASTATTGLLVASTTAVLNRPGENLVKVNYYDDLGRSIKTYTQHYMDMVVDSGNYDAYTNTYNFTNAVTGTVRQHNEVVRDSVTSVLSIANEYLYDHMGRKTKTWETITSDSGATPRTLISKLDYNELGQVKAKHLGSTDSTNFLQDIAYGYNERGWLLADSAGLFNEQLQYEQPGANPQPQYNGNIAGQRFGNDTIPYGKSFVYTYDKLNRLTSGIQDSTFSEHNITYDVAGNIQTLNRVYNGNLIDSLTYSYNGTNQLNSLTDASLYVGSNPGFDGYPYGTYAYSYDGNGNMTYDASKSLATSYNILNLPNNAYHDEYIYDANGVKLARLGKGSRPVYDDGLQRDLGTSILQTEDGRAVTGRDGRYAFQYYLTDHLGNTRVVFNNPGDTLKVEQRDDYLPFGMDISIVNNAGNNYLYNRKELQNDTWLYDYGARYYDPVVGRFTTVDPLAEGMRRFSPYVYCGNNPIRFVDPDGMFFNEYEVVVQDGKVKSTTMTGTKGGDVTDYITLVNLDAAPYASGVTKYAVDVQTSYTSGPPNDYGDGSVSQKRHPTPGVRLYHGSTPTDIQAYLWLATGLWGRSAAILKGAGSFAPEAGVKLTQALSEAGGSKSVAAFLGWGDKTIITKTAADFTKKQLLEAGYTKEVLHDIYSGLVEAGQKTIPSTGVANPASVARAQQVLQILKTHF